MADQPAPQGVNLLKELLFEPETKRLDDMGRLIEAQAKATTARDKLLGDRIDAVGTLGLRGEKAEAKGRAKQCPSLQPVDRFEFADDSGRDRELRLVWHAVQGNR